MKLNRIIALVLSITVLSTYNLIAGAESPSDVDTFEYGGYICYENNGAYCTVVDGQECIVLVATEDNRITDEALIAKLNASVGIIENQSRANPTNWPNPITFDVSEGAKYSGTADITNGDYYTPMFNGKASPSGCGYKMKTSFILNNYYDVNIHYYDSISRTWHSQTMTLSFSWIVNEKIFLSGTATPYIEHFCMEIYEGSDGNETFNYTFWQLV